MAAGEDPTLELFLQSVLAALNTTNSLQAEITARLEQIERDRMEDRKKIAELVEFIKGNGKPGLRQRADTVEVALLAMNNDFYGKDQTREGIFYRFTDLEKRWSWIVWPVLMSLAGTGLWFFKMLGEFLFKKATGG